MGNKIIRLVRVHRIYNTWMDFLLCLSTALHSLFGISIYLCHRSAAAPLPDNEYNV